MACIFNDVVSSSPETLDRGLRKSTHPLQKKIRVKDEILFSPTDEHGLLAQAGQISLDSSDQRISRVIGMERNVLDKAEDCPPIGGLAIWGQVPLPHLAGHGMHLTPYTAGDSGKQV